MTTEKTDRELLELAAKAAGMRLTFRASGDPFAQKGFNSRAWNPLTDDGDAIRLAETLSISIHWCITGRVYAHAKGGIVEVYESSREDRAANLRRAIVRAAAKIGERMP